MLRIGIVVEARDLAIAAGSIQVQGFVERSIGVQTDSAKSTASGFALPLGQQTPTETESPRIRRNPHALDLADAARQRSQSAAADRLAKQSCHEQTAVWRQKNRTITPAATFAPI